MLSKQELIDEVLSLNSDIDRRWIEISRKRLNELSTGKIKGISGDEVFDKIWKRFEK